MKRPDLCAGASRRGLCLTAWGLVLAASALAAAPGFGQTPPGGGAALDPVQEGREALSGRRNYPWYDRSQDAVRRIDLAAPTEPAPEQAVAANTPKATAPPRAGTSSWELGPLLQLLGLVVLLTALGLAAWFVARAFMNQEVAESHAVRVVEAASDVDRVENLPFTLERPTGDFLDEARRLYEAGRYAEAIVYYYSYLLVQLDRRHVIRLAKGKTNRQYLREARRAPPLAQVLEPTMVAFEDVFFGHHPLPRERFEQCWRGRESFLLELEQRTLA